MNAKITAVPSHPFLRNSLFLACLSAVAVPVHAQMLEEVIVTAQKREQNLQDVPIAVTAFTGDMLEQSGITDMFDLQSNAPSLRVGQTQNASTTTFSIRGVFTSSQNFGLESSVGLYVDGVYRARQGSMINNMVDVAGVEVLRGPQGTLFGRNTPSGAVSIFSVKPDHEGTGFIEASVGSYDLLNVSGAVSVSAIDNVLAFRATGFVMERDGFVDAIGIGDDAINDRDRWGGRLQALYTPTDEITIHISADRSEVDEICCGTGTFKNNFLADDLPAGSPPVTGTDVIIEQLGGTVLRGEDFYDLEVATSYLPVSTNEDEGISMQIDWETDTFSVTSISAYRSFESFDDVDSDFSDIDALDRSNNAEQSSFSQELRISNETDNFTYVAGLYYFEQDLDSVTDTIVGEDTTVLVSAFGEAFPAGTGSRNVAQQEHQSYAVFGQFDYNISEELLLTAGLRWTNEKKDLVNTFTEDASAALDFVSPGWGFYLFPPLAPRNDVDTKIDDDQITGTVKLSWFMNDTTMFYASYGTGYKSGGVNVDRIDEILDVEFDAETSESFELGVKADFPDQALRVNFALHRTDTEDLQTISFQGTAFALTNAGVAETYGAELEVHWAATETLNLTMGYAYNHGEYSDFEGGPCWVASTFHTGLPDPTVDENGSCDRSGGDLSSNPENAFVVTANQEFRFSDDVTGFVYGEYAYTDDRVTDVNNDPLKDGDSYGLVNLRAGVRLEKYDIQLTAWGRNILDEEYTNTIADSVAQNGKLNAYYQEPATFGVTAKKHF
ncbi:MAG: iron complex outermembrane receptor protein [Halioglobus sp.]|jgi:outer membrane receptor protein involved in Fe transport